MVRILHFSDLHLGVETYGRIDPQTGLNTRLLDCLAALDDVIDRALADPVDLVLFSGDAYKNREPTQTHQREFAKRVARLAGGGVPLAIVVGNHDLPNSQARAHSVEIFDTLRIPNVHIARSPKEFTIQTRSGPIQLFAVPWMPRSVILRQENMSDLTVDEVNAKIVELIYNEVALTAKAIDPAVPSILAIHGQINGAKFGSERRSTLGSDYILSIGSLAYQAFDYIALGHVHRNQELWPRPPAVYAGSLQRTDFGEEHEPKGYVIVDIDPAPAEEGCRPFTTRWEFIDSPYARRFLTIEIDAQTGDPNDTVQAVLTQRADDIRGSIVRLRIRLSRENEAMIREAEVRRSLANAAAVAAVSREVDRAVTPSGGPGVEQLTPRDALERYLIAREVPEARRAELLAAADSLIATLD